MDTDTIFPSNIEQQENCMVFTVPFHLGIPLAIHCANGLRGWEPVQKHLRARIAADADFQLMDVSYCPDTKFPIGAPISVRYRHFDDLLPVAAILAAECGIAAEQVSIDHLIWISPAGMVYLIVKVHYLHPEARMAVTVWNDLAERYYANITCVFLAVARCVYAVFPERNLSTWYISPSCTARTKDAIRRFETHLAGYGNRVEGLRAAWKWLSRDENARLLFEDILIDVYFVDYYPHEPAALEVGYVSAVVKGGDGAYLLMIAISHLSLITALWFGRLLGEQSRMLEELTFNAAIFSDKMTAEVKILRVFMHSFLNESAPMNIRLTMCYMLCLERCFVEFRTAQVFESVNRQMALLEEMIGQNYERKASIRNHKIGLGGMILAVISITAVVAQIISTLDTQTTLGMIERARLIFAGFSVGAISVLLLYRLPTKL